MARPLPLALCDDAGAHVVHAVAAQFGDLVGADGDNEVGLGGLLRAGSGVDQHVVLGQVHAVAGRAREDGRVPDDAAGVVAAQRGEEPAVVRPGIDEAAENPRRDRGDVAGLAGDFAVLAFRSPAEFPCALEDHEDFGGEMDVQVVDDAMRHGGGADVEAMRLAQVDDLVGAGGDARPDDRIVLLEMRPRRLAIDEGDGAGHVVRAPDQPFACLML